MLQKLNFKIKITICLRKNFRKVRLKRKTNRENKQTNKRNKKQTTSKNNKKRNKLPTQPIFPKDFLQVAYLFPS